MDKICGANIFVREPVKLLMRGEKVVGHRHNFDHVTYIQRGKFEVVTDEWTKTISADDWDNFVLIKKNKVHSFTALEDNSRYQCIFAHRMPQAMTIGVPGELDSYPYTKRDELGLLWVRVDETVIQDSTGWTPAYE